MLQFSGETRISGDRSQNSGMLFPHQKQQAYKDHRLFSAFFGGAGRQGFWRLAVAFQVGLHVGVLVACRDKGGSRSG